MLESPERFAEVLLVGRDRLVEIVTPQVTDCRPFHIFLVFEQRHYTVELRAAIADADVPQRDPFFLMIRRPPRSPLFPYPRSSNFARRWLLAAPPPETST